MKNIKVITRMTGLAMATTIALMIASVTVYALNCGTQVTASDQAYASSCNDGSCVIYLPSDEQTCTEGTECMWCSMTDESGNECKDLMTALALPGSCQPNGPCTLTSGIGTVIPWLGVVACDSGNDCERCRES